MIDTVYILEHNHDLDGAREGNLIGAFSTPEAAEHARAVVADQPGFRDFPDGFVITPFVVDELVSREP
jgi:hypothetical protein